MHIEINKSLLFQSHCFHHHHHCHRSHYRNLLYRHHVYQQISIKNIERVEHGSQASISFSQIARGQKIKQWRNFLCNSQNKARLIEFLVSDWSSESQRKKLKGKDVYVTLSDICKQLTDERVCEVDDLKCRNEEADTRMILRAVHCSTGSNAVVVVSEDRRLHSVCQLFITSALSSVRHMWFQYKDSIL